MPVSAIGGQHPLILTYLCPLAHEKQSLAQSMPPRHAKYCPKCCFAALTSLSPLFRLDFSAMKLAKQGFIV